ncbi:nuclear transport factor 2 family protein [Altibacter sp.]|uniref:YybH family protein n=1 Tax=Altibacter sp. TaxID=2024823 RepID=UPI0025851ACD|nr:nuclear transport factor 2 family protein [Altibacter sp.]MCW9038656.1 nuclear transport factor 2 family protein [Altibacter sp.]
MHLFKINRIRTVLLLSCSLMVCSLTAQNFENNSEDAILQQVWQPFKTSYEARDAEAFKALHADDMLRITDENLLTGMQYKASVDNWKPLPADSSIFIDFALESSKVSGSHAYQVGYYRVLFTEKDKEPTAYYGQFHVVLKLLDGRWMIIQDFDTGTVNGKAVNADFFNNARLMKLH